ncbi:MAG: cob(I)yrinic acid a,c-diamide adenosyltransferase, partial [Pseudomonadota bacterium]
MTDNENKNNGSASDIHKAKMQALQRAQKERVAKANTKRGILIVNTGNGKGKSSSAFGTAIRAAGHGQK